MKSNQTHYHLRLAKQSILAAVTLGVLVSGLMLTLTQVGQVQTLAQNAQTPANGNTCQHLSIYGNCCDNQAADPAKLQACLGYGTKVPGAPQVNNAPATASASAGSTQPAGAAAGAAGGTQPNAGPTCNTKTPLNPDEAKILDGICPKIDPQAQNACKDFCMANPDSAQCKKPDANGKNGGIYHCETPNKTAGTAPGKCQKVTSCGASGTAPGYCATADGICCRVPAPAPPAPPATAAKTAPVLPRTAPKTVAKPPAAGTVAKATPLATCRKTCKAPNKCNSNGYCYNPAATGGGKGNGAGTGTGAGAGGAKAPAPANGNTCKHTAIYGNCCDNANAVIQQACLGYGTTVPGAPKNNAPVVP